LTIGRTRNGFAQGLLAFGKPPHGSRLRFARAGPLPLVPGEANAGESGAGGDSIGHDGGKLVEIRPATGVKRQRCTAADAALG